MCDVAELQLYSYVMACILATCSKCDVNDFIYPRVVHDSRQEDFYNHLMDCYQKITFDNYLCNSLS